MATSNKDLMERTAEKVVKRYIWLYIKIVLTILVGVMAISFLLGLISGLNR